MTSPNINRAIMGLRARMSNRIVLISCNRNCRISRQRAHQIVREQMLRKQAECTTLVEGQEA